MKNSSFLINTARGSLVDENDLFVALKNRVIAGAALDVYSIEPPEAKGLTQLPNVICTPHMAGTSEESSLALGMTAINNLRNFFEK